MSGRRPRPMIGKLSELLVTGKKPAGFYTDAATSPTSPFDFRTPIPRGVKRFDAGGVGLGIVAALDKSTTGSCRHAVCSSNLIVASSGKNFDGVRGRYEDLEMDKEEEFTYVISHGSGSSSTKVYYDVKEMETPPPPPAAAAAARFVEDVSFPTSDFLSCCHLCRKQLHGRDIYMYRGENAFCSSECRSTQMMMDERKERCRSEVSRSYNSGEIFFSTGILAI
ncbi:hypothetical protein V6N13_095045 [Hibiscus sabdariffa]|uniref:FLZ-type domain-containing protein n=1 Tax=Hibiscus sabdariffa TaxID=183260 RepID=A0ABR2PSY1_9ROSI